MENAVNDISRRRPGGKKFLLAVFLASAVSLSLAVLVGSLLQVLGKEIHGPEFTSGYVGMALKAGVLGPLAETAVMAGMISLVFRPLLGRDAPVVIATALAWGLLHGMFEFAWGVIVFFPFLVFAKVYTMFLRFGFWWAFAAASMNHALHNLIAVTWEYI